MWIVWMTFGAAIGAGLTAAVPPVLGTVQKMLAEFKAHFGG